MLVCLSTAGQVRLRCHRKYLPPLSYDVMLYVLQHDDLSYSPSPVVVSPACSIFFILDRAAHA